MVTLLTDNGRFETAGRAAACDRVRCWSHSRFTEDEWRNIL